MARGSNRTAGPCTPRIATSVPAGLSTGAAIALRSSSRSPAASAQPLSLARATSTSSTAGSTIVRSV